ncbi:1-phosphatidylinositol 4,5-bisphosphate phosphodiesterase gamma-1-like isoform X1 [Xenia sp. Carnegie-2017]|uniref:1-phosphatidylinositol 4,5-bisphosphate phosphodiesterase gamma-1-like isoform X1 n=1 Tax=Xenia sp. Carnegie-2017 TaxID=2897299 RepID=UPI001F04F3C0|nr:1-phosphatidylinositol 4,5-bisphosphate phosphodiesterase gamma-1-like isoform X1 [Xenia sp. Carnegie-2017]
MNENPYMSQPNLIYRWLLKEWSLLTSSIKKEITMKEVKQFLQRANIKMNNARVRELFQDVDTKKLGHINFDGFRYLYNVLMYQREIASYFYSFRNQRNQIHLEQFQRFLLEEQKENFAQDISNVKEYMSKCLGVETREHPFFSMNQFIDYLFSRSNCVLDGTSVEVYQDMTKPLSHYWIASSHNTYLTGDQFSSESSVEAYVRCLRMGCRCIELDYWDGPDNQPVIYHGFTLTSKIKFVDVVKAIKENAFVASDYPLILSIKNHCSLLQQNIMAKTFTDIFGDMLLCFPLDPNEECLPSPEQLKHKILIKHKKLPTDADVDDMVNIERDFIFMEDELSDLTKNGILYLEDEMDKVWNKHFFVLYKNRLFWMEETKSEDDDEPEQDGQWDGPLTSESSRDELHYGERWFHQRIRREAATKLMRQYNKGNGSFLVRESPAFVGDFSLTFWRNGEVQHCRIKSKQENGQAKYYLVEPVTFDSLFSLVNYYQVKPLRTPQFEYTLTEPIAQPNAHLEKEWFHANLQLAEAENMLKRAPSDGSFLVRKKTDSEFAVSFKAEGKIKHCQIYHEGRLYTIGTAQFESLIELVEFYEKHPLYRKIKLKHPINEEVLRRIGIMPDHDAVDPSEVYLDPRFNTKPVCRALWDYQAQSNDEMSFCKGVFITNVIKEDGGWWRGDFGEYQGAWFPSNFCEEINVMVEPAKDFSDDQDVKKVLGDLQKGSMDIRGCNIEQLPPRGGFKCIFSIQSNNQPPLEVAAETPEEMSSWVHCIKDAMILAEEREERVRTAIRENKIDKALSDLVVYLQTVPFHLEKKGKHYEMSSFPETKVDKFTNQKNSQKFVQYNLHQFSRVYPKGTRVDSSNYDPTPMWNCGVQMAALNYQTPDRAMQINHGKFLDNGCCGYILKPDCARIPEFDPFDKTTISSDIKPLIIKLTFIGARHLPKARWGISSPFVEVELIGASYDNYKYKTGTKSDNGLNPVWSDAIETAVFCPPLAYIRFAVYDEDMFGDPNFIAQAVYPLSNLKNGYRSVPLKNSFSEEYEQCALLIHLDITYAGEEEETLCTYTEISSQMHEEAVEITCASNDGLGPPVEAGIHKMQTLDAQLREKQEELQLLIQKRGSSNNASRQHLHHSTSTDV